MTGDKKPARGKFVVFYSGHNRGKTTQANEVVKALRQMGKTAYHLKYPVLEIEPTGSLINSYMRGGNPKNISSTTIQLLHVRNQLIAQKEIILPALERGIWIIAEDYKGTTLAYARATELGDEFISKLKLLQKPLLDPDFAFIFKGRRFIEAREEGHRHESEDVLAQRAYEIHLELAEKYEWTTIRSDQAMQKVTGDILDVIFSHNPKDQNSRL